jgi:hypothetical protein
MLNFPTILYKTTQFVHKQISLQYIYNFLFIYFDFPRLRSRIPIKPIQYLVRPTRIQRTLRLSRKVSPALDESLLYFIKGAYIKWQ